MKREAEMKDVPVLHLIVDLLRARERKLSRDLEGLARPPEQLRLCDVDLLATGEESEERQP